MIYQVPPLRFISIINIPFLPLSTPPFIKKKKNGVQLSLEVCFSAFLLSFPKKKEPIAWSDLGKTPLWELREPLET